MKGNYRDKRLLNMARDKQCLLRVSGICNNDPSTTVACHSNQGEHGKGMSIKAHDFHTVWGCSSCHAHIDQGMGSKEEKQAIYNRASRLQLTAWQAIIEGDYESEADKEAARSAIEGFKRWVTENKWRFSGDDWQLEYLECPNCKEYGADEDWQGYTNGCTECERRMRDEQ